MRQVGRFNGALVEVGVPGGGRRPGTISPGAAPLHGSDGVVIRVWWRVAEVPGAMSLVNVLAPAGSGAKVTIDREYGWMKATIGYGDGVDDRLVDLVDLLAAIRYAYPKMVQLELGLTGGEAEGLEGALEGVAAPRPYEACHG